MTRRARHLKILFAKIGVPHCRHAASGARDTANRRDPLPRRGDGARTRDLRATPPRGCPGRAARVLSPRFHPARRPDGAIALDSLRVSPSRAAFSTIVPDLLPCSSSPRAPGSSTRWSMPSRTDAARAASSSRRRLPLRAMVSRASTVRVRLRGGREKPFRPVLSSTPLAPCETCAASAHPSTSTSNLVIPRIRVALSRRTRSRLCRQGDVRGSARAH